MDSLRGGFASKLSGVHHSGSSPTELTPWLAQQLSELGNTLGMDLELHDQEVPVGKNSTDILARDFGSDRLVIIEDQLESTDNDYLGKLLTSAAGHSANAVVWIAKELRETHSQALDRLSVPNKTGLNAIGLRCFCRPSILVPERVNKGERLDIIWRDAKPARSGTTAKQGRLECRGRRLVCAAGRTMGELSRGQPVDDP